MKDARYFGGANSCLCGDITQLDIHLKYAETSNKHGNSCKGCGMLDYSKCSICVVYLHFTANRGKSVGRTFFLDHRNDAFFSLSHEDVGLSKTKIKEWNYPSLAKKR